MGSISLPEKVALLLQGLRSGAECDNFFSDLIALQFVPVDHNVQDHHVESVQGELAEGSSSVSRRRHCRHGQSELFLSRKPDVPSDPRYLKQQQQLYLDDLR